MDSSRRIVCRCRAAERHQAAVRLGTICVSQGHAAEGMQRRSEISAVRTRRLISPALCRDQLFAQLDGHNLDRLKARVKGDMEAAVQALGDASVTILLPSLLAGERLQWWSRMVSPCFGEWIALAPALPFAALVPRKHRAIPVLAVARAARNAARGGSRRAGRRVRPAAGLRRTARSASGRLTGIDRIRATGGRHPCRVSLRQVVAHDRTRPGRVLGRPVRRGPWPRAPACRQSYPRSIATPRMSYASRCSSAP